MWVGDMKTRKFKSQREFLLNSIRKLNPTAKLAFLESLTDKDLAYYLRELRGLDVRELRFCR